MYYEQIKTLTVHIIIYNEILYVDHNIYKIDNFFTCNKKMKKFIVLLFVLFVYFYLYSALPKLVSE